MLIESNPMGTTKQKKQPDGPPLVIVEAKHADLQNCKRRKHPFAADCRAAIHQVQASPPKYSKQFCGSALWFHPS